VHFRARTMHSSTFMHLGCESRWQKELVVFLTSRAVQAMLAEHVRDPCMTWNDARDKLRQDERFVCVSRFL